jgi:hypothetical protein
MARMGHDRERAAMIYQHEAQGADKTITEEDREDPGSLKPRCRMSS